MNNKYRYPQWMEQTGATNILHLTKGEKAHIIIADLGFIENIEIFQHRLLYYVPADKTQSGKGYYKLTDVQKNFHPHSTGVASISIGNFLSTNKEYSAYGLANQAICISVNNILLQSIVDPKISMTTTILHSLGIDSRDILNTGVFKLTNIINLSIGQENTGMMATLQWLLGIGTFNNIDSVNLNKFNDDFLLVIAAGNDGKLLSEDGLDAGWFEKTIKLSQFFPALLKLQKSTNVIIVGGMTEDYTAVSDTTNYSKFLVDIAAPSKMLPMLESKNTDIITQGGTTYAAAIVSATAELMLSCNNRLSGTEIKNIILEEANILEKAKDKIKEGRVLNIEKAIKKACISDEDYSLEYLNSIIDVKEEDTSISKLSKYFYAKCEADFPYDKMCHPMDFLALGEE